ncbi:MAG: hypothetical protein HZA54_06385 [Planctomycetes bacterium]|nr:hypothetical protein [Planctomycetota bacterium]
MTTLDHPRSPRRRASAYAAGGACALGAALLLVLALPPVATHAEGGAALEVVPLILLHGHGADPVIWSGFLERYGRGRAVVAETYAADVERLRPGSMPKASIFNAGYYKDTATGIKFDPDARGEGQGSIGGCPVPRDDGQAARFPISYARRVARIVEGVRRATGSERVDLAMHSMGNLVGRAYVRWFSLGSDGRSKVRRLFCIAGPHRGINALEATVDGLKWHGVRDYMLMGELAEMCGEYKAWRGEAYIDHLNRDWDTFASRVGVAYAGITAPGCVGKQVDPRDPDEKGIPSLLGFKLKGPAGAVMRALGGASRKTWPDVKPYWNIWGPKVAEEFSEALGPGDGTVRVVSSRMDTPPFARAAAWMIFEGHHGGEGEGTEEQSPVGSTFTAELAREFLFEGRVRRGGRVERADLRLVNAPGRASWLVLETEIAGAPLLAAQIVEEDLNFLGRPRGPARAYGCPLPTGQQRAFVAVPRGGGKRRYRLVLYGPQGAVTTKEEITYTLTHGNTQEPPTTDLDLTTTTTGFTDRLDRPGRTTDPVSSGGGRGSSAVTVTARSNAAEGDPTLAYSFKLDDGEWRPFGAQASWTTPGLAPGEHRIEARARHGNNAAVQICDDAKGAVLGVLVGRDGKVTTR